MLSRRSFCKSGAATALLSSSVATGMSKTRQPNFVVILADDLGYGDIGSFGSPNIMTPRIDRLVEEGLKLTCVYAEPFCGPARASIMTGSYPIRVAEPGNLKHRHTVLHLRESTIAEVLKPAGYRSAMIGKWGDRCPIEQQLATRPPAFAARLRLLLRNARKQRHARRRCSTRRGRRDGRISGAARHSYWPLY